MRNVGYTSQHSRPVGAVIYGKIYNFGGHVNKPIKNQPINTYTWGSCCYQ